MKLLLVEDDRLLGSSLQTRLAEVGCVVDRVRTCDEAATAARLSAYTLIPRPVHSRRRADLQIRVRKLTASG